MEVDTRVNGKIIVWKVKEFSIGRMEKFIVEVFKIKIK
jgi:hypothetical protein